MSHRSILLLLCAALTACGDGFVPGQPLLDDMGADLPADLPTTGPCAGVDCGPTGRCVDLSGAPSCACGAGSVPQGLTCVPASATPSLVVNVLGQPITTEVGGAARVTVQLSQPPMSNVIVPLSLTINAVASLDAPSLVFSPETWSAPQTVTLTGEDDGAAMGERAYMLVVGPTSSQDPAFSDLEQSVALTSKESVCGDGVTSGAERCDDGVSNGQYDRCATTCDGLGLRCGDGAINGVEACDGAALGGATCPSGTAGAPACDAACRLDLSGCLDAAVALAASRYFTCALTQAGAVKCWGDHYSDTPGASPQVVPGLEQGVAAIDGERENMCALLRSGAVKCWGQNYAGQLGDGTTTDSATPVDVREVSGASAIAVGGGFACAIVAGGRVKCWGSNYAGQLGIGAEGVPMLASLVADLSGASAIAAASESACALVASGVVCWGSNFSSNLGDGTSTQRLTPVSASGLTSGQRAVAAGGHWGSGCAVSSAGSLKCWGDNSDGQLGDGTTTDRSVAITVNGLSNVTSVSLGQGHTCASLRAGVVKCWGDGSDGQLGDDFNARRLNPVDVLNLRDVASVTAGPTHTCALLTTGGVKCWGENQQGQLGDGTATQRDTPVSASGFVP